MTAEQTPTEHTRATRVVTLLGPTGTGKTGLAVELARHVDISVINFDSRQVYGDFPVITAQPSAEERQACPHLLYGFLGCGEKITAARFAELARESIAQVVGQGRLPVLVGGTGMYLKALLEGLAPIPDIPAEVHRAVVERVRLEGSQKLHRELLEIDPVYAARIHPNDSQRNARAREVFEATGKPLSWWHTQKHDAAPLAPLRLGLSLDIDALTPRLASRIDEMLEQGALDEARTAWERCPDPDAPGWSGIGCAELLSHLRGRLSLAEARALWVKNTRAYARRQVTWCRREKDTTWLEPGQSGELLRLVRQWMNSSS